MGATLSEHCVGRSEDFTVGVLESRRVEDVDLVILKTSEEGYFAFLDECPHQPVRLSDFGECRGNQLVCHAHGGVFDLPHGGAVLGGPPPCPLKMFKIIEKDKKIIIFI